MHGSPPYLSQSVASTENPSAESANADGVAPLSIVRVQQSTGDAVLNRPLPRLISMGNTPAELDRSAGSPPPLTVVEGDRIGSDSARDLNGIKLKEVELEPEDFKQLLARGNFSDDTCYKVKGSLEFADDMSDWETCSWPRNVCVEGSLKFEKCAETIVFPDNLEVKDTLGIYAFSGPTKLPENLKLGKLLVVSCSGLTALPGNLEVDGDLIIIDCSGLTALPERAFSVGGAIVLRDCTGLTSLPGWITELGETKSGRVRYVYLQGSGLSDTLLEELCSRQATGMEFVLGWTRR